MGFSWEVWSSLQPSPLATASHFFFPLCFAWGSVGQTPDVTVLVKPVTFSGHSCVCLTPVTNPDTCWLSCAWDGYWTHPRSGLFHLFNLVKQTRLINSPNSLESNLRKSSACKGGFLEQRGGDELYQGTTATNFLPPQMGREKDVGYWPHTLMMQYPTVMKASIKVERHHEVSTLMILFIWSCKDS